MANKCCFAYPTLEDAQAAAKNLSDMSLGATELDECCASHCGWVIDGYMRSQVIPTPCPDKAAAKAKLAAKLGQLKSLKTGDKAALNIDWINLFKDILAVLKDLGIAIPFVS